MWWTPYKKFCVVTQLLHFRYQLSESELSVLHTTVVFNNKNLNQIIDWIISTIDDIAHSF